MKKATRHWPSLVVAAFVLLVVATALMTFRVHHTEHAVILRFGEPMTNRALAPGLHMKWPFESVWRIDNRIRCFDGDEAALEEVFTADEKNLLISVYIGWRVADDQVITFLNTVQNTDRAEEHLAALLRSYKNGVLGQYRLEDLINADPAHVRIAEIEAKMLEMIRREAAALFGIDVAFLGIRQIGFPEAITDAVFERMKAERETVAQAILTAGESEAMRIRAESDSEREILLATAEGDATRIRAEGDAEAAKNYAVFQRNPELAVFLRKLDSLRRTLSEKTTLILDTDTVPYDLLDEDALARPPEPSPQPAAEAR